MENRVGILLGVLFLLMCSSCSYFANRPLDILEYKSEASTPTKNLFVFMRGLGGNHQSFDDAGMVDDVISRDISFDMIAPNAHFAYYAERTLIQRLHDDVIVPAVSQGYTNIWLVGVSMGGLGSLMYFKEKPEYISGIFLISPFLGYEEIIEEVSDAGVRSWEPGSYDPDDDWERMFWHWIRDSVDGKKTIPIFLGFGEEDKYSKGQRLFSTVIPPKRVLSQSGEHDIPTFTSLWNRFLTEKMYLTGGP